MKFKQLLLATLAAASLSATVLAAPIDIAGVKVEDSATVAGTKLQLNGAGIRYKFVVKVYVAELYTSKKVTNLEELIAAPGPKRLGITMLRDIDARELGKLLTRGMEDNATKGEISKLISGLLRMGTIFAEQKNLKAGDKFDIDWVPGKGSVITVKGVVQGEPFPEPDFFKALMSIWLGNSPADYKLKEALMGVKNP